MRGVEMQLILNAAFFSCPRLRSEKRRQVLKCYLMDDAHGGDLVLLSVH